MSAQAPDSTVAPENRIQRIAREAAQHLSVWLEHDECDCDPAGHSCGREAVVRTRYELQELADAPLPAAPAPTEQPSHETIVQEGDTLVCTTCGTTVDIIELELAGMSKEIDRQIEGLSDLDESSVDPTTLALANEAVKAVAGRNAQPVAALPAEQVPIEQAYIPPGYSNETEWLRAQLKEAKTCIKAHQSVLAERDAALAARQAPMHFKLVAITSPGFEGWANLIYTGSECDGLCLALVPPYVATDFRSLLATRQVVAPDGATLRNWLAMVHDNELSLGDRLQRLSCAFRTLLDGGAVDSTPYVVREQTFCACTATEAMGRARPVVDGAVERDARTDAQVLRDLTKLYDEFMADSFAQTIGIGFKAWAAQHAAVYGQEKAS